MKKHNEQISNQIIHTKDICTSLKSLGRLMIGCIAGIAAAEALGASVPTDTYLPVLFGISCMAIGIWTHNNGIHQGKFLNYMHYWKEVKFYALMTPVMIAIMFLSYNISVYAGWREPVADMMVYIPIFIGATISYIFLTPLINYYLYQNQDTEISTL